MSSSKRASFADGGVLTPGGVGSSAGSQQICRRRVSAARMSSCARSMPTLAILLLMLSRSSPAM